jgi:GAF domain-containing protein
VNAFPGHIACDSASASELVVPIIRDGQLLVVLDLDSPKPSRFSEADEAGCVAVAEILARAL